MLAFAIAAVLGTTMTAQAADVMTHHVRDEVRTGAALRAGSLAPQQAMNIDVVLPVRDRAGLDAFVKGVTDPSSVMFRQYLTPKQFTERFGPTQGDYDTVVKYLVKNGFTITGGSRDGMEVQARGPVTAVEAAFNVRMLTWRDPTDGHVFYGPDREPTTALAIPLWHVSGLDNNDKRHPMYEKKSDYAKAHGISPDAVVGHATTGSGPSASFLGSDMRAAYYGSGSLNGAGQTLGLFEYYGTDLADLTTYYKNVKQTNNVPVNLISTDGTSTACLYTKKGGDCDDGEQNLDLTQAIGMAPGLTGVSFFVGSTDTAIISAMTTHTPLASVNSCSWGWTPADASTLDPYFEKMAAQGQTFFVASGDDSTWTKSGNAESWPADDAYIIAVGGTDLTTASAGGAWKSETAWVDSGGGISPNKIAIPSWQKLSGVITSTNKGSTTYRNGPDVAANANFTFYTCGDQQACQANEYGGTSFAAPMWAAFTALANQQSVAGGKKTLGNFNALIYPLALTSSYSTDFHDITSGKSGSYSANTGFDLVTGWGSPKAALISALHP
ncbi:MAG TPA: S53 family serine peptidase [Xanthomonadaceae bacterium]|nr:S53 family serine peptidase [Xanthomonadaceae bacterium]